MMILGIDEVGRGPWAGPLVVGAVVWPDGVMLDGLTDSKKVTAKKRIVLDEQIRNQALGFGLGWVHAEEIDAVGLSAALRLATIRAVEAVNAPYHEIIIDGTINFLKETAKGRYVKTMPKADLLVPAVSAASIIAKVARDGFMEQQDELYPEYGFASHIGYGTAKHSKALLENGVTPLHRRSFAPIAKLLGLRPENPVMKSKQVSTTSKGLAAEALVSEALKSTGHQIVERNWRTKRCEIDIISETIDVRYFVEVKYRSSQKQGGGMEAVTTAKLHQMEFAAELFNASHRTSKSSQLLVASVNEANEVTLLEVS